MNLNQLRRNEALLEKLASEYVLGTLRGGARRRFEAWMRDDAVVRQAVTRWQGRLAPMAEFAEPVQPPARVWDGLEQELGLTERRERGWLSRLGDNLAFWRGLGLVSSAAAAVLLAVLLVRQPDGVPAPPSYIATLADERAQVAMLVSGYPGRNELTVRVLAAPEMDEDRSLELWAVPPTGQPRSLGLVSRSGTSTLPLPPGVTPEEAALLAVSLEPRGGSPSPAGPTGPILYKGPWLRVES